jgi:anti-sigma B factor antagonist
MNISTRTVDAVTVVDLDGRLRLGEDTEQFRTHVRGLLDSGSRKILLNMRNIHQLDSSGVGELVHAFATVTSQDGQLKLLHLTKRLHDMLSVTKLLTVFETFDDERRAIDSFTE